MNKLFVSTIKPLRLNIDKLITFKIVPSENTFSCLSRDPIPN